MFFFPSVCGVQWVMFFPPKFIPMFFLPWVGGWVGGKETTPAQGAPAQGSREKEVHLVGEAWKAMNIAVAMAAAPTIATASW